MHRHLLLFALICMVRSVFCQRPSTASGRLIGTVTDTTDGTPVPGVVARVFGSSLGTITDEEGHYEIANVPVGRQVVIFSLMGHTSDTVPVLIETGVPTRCYARLGPAPLDGGPPPPPRSPHRGFERIVKLKTTKLPVLREGDILFQDLDCGALCEAIEAVTEGAQGRDYSHVGIVTRLNGKKVIAEAIGGSVHTSDERAFLARGTKVSLGRMRDRRLAKRAAREALQLLGVPYDEAFLPGTDRLYCSELVALAYERANHGASVFPATPMTFKAPGSGTYFPVWVSYYAALGLTIPEGEPGCNPGALSRSEHLRVIWSSY